MSSNNDLNMDNNFIEHYAWVDQRLEQLYLDEQDRYQAYSLLENEELEFYDDDVEEEDDDDDDDDDDDEEILDIIHLTEYDHMKEEDNFRVICRRLFTDEDDSETTETDILSEISSDIDLYYQGNEGEALDSLELLEGPPLVRSNTVFQINGITLYNGNPNGSRFFEPDDFEPIT
jgi:hypothetical protein